MKTKFFTLILFFLLFLCGKSFSQITYPCGAYYAFLKDQGDYGYWSNVYPTNDYTLAAWVQIQDSVWQGNEMDIFQREVIDQYNDGLDLYISSDGYFKFRLYTAPSPGILDSINSTVKPKANQWYHVAVTFQSTGVCNFYINGNLTASKTFSGGMIVNSPYLNYLCVGGKSIYFGINNPTSNTFKGYMDELAVASQAFTQGQIDTLANGIAPGDPFLTNNHVDSYDKEDAPPGAAAVNSGISGGQVGIVAYKIACPVINQPPIADAGPDQTITLPTNSVTLNGSATPGTGTIVSGVWSKVSGPAGGDISDPNSQTPVITNLQAGTYVFELTITDDKGVTGTDEVNIFVKPASVQIIDPNPLMILDDGSLSTDQSKINLNPNVIGAATDGVTKLLLVADATVPITFSLSNPKDGFLFSLDNQIPSTLPVSITPQNGKAVCVYEVPDGYGVNNPAGGRNITVQVYQTDDQSTQTSISINLVTPPVVLVHGMWSDPSVWDDGGFTDKLFANKFSIIAANYKAFNSWTFNPNSPASLPGRESVDYAIKQSLSDLRKDGIAVAQVDVVGHSMGGLMTRSLSQQPEFVNVSNYQKGYVHKLITLGTPHRGTPFGTELWNHKDNIVEITVPVLTGESTITFPIKLSDFMKAAGRPIGSCHLDFGIESEGIKALQQTLPFKTYAITANYKGNGNAQEQTLGYNALNYLCITIFNKSLNEILSAPSICANSVLDNDLLVPLSSQTGYINSDTLFWGTIHTLPLNVTETNNPLIQNKVIELLLSDNPTEFSVGFPAPSQFPLDCTTATERNRTITSENQRASIASRIAGIDSTMQLIQITSPVRGTIYQQNSGANLTLSFKTSGGALLTSALFIIDGDDWIPVTDLSSGSVNFTLPNNSHTGSLNIVLIARDTTGIILADTSHIVITPSGVLDSLSVAPEIIKLDTLIRENSVYVNGYFKTNSGIIKNDLSNGSTGTMYSSQKGGTIFKVSQDGLVTAISAGTDTLLITNNGITIKVPVFVDSNFVNVSLFPNAIDFSPIPDKIVTDVPFALDATNSSGEDVSFNLISGPVNLQNGVVTITGTGTVTIEATSSGDAYFADATPVYRTFSINSALPLTLLNFYGSLNNKEVDLKWQTAQEINTSYFEIERSADGNNFSAIGQVNASGNSASTENYSFTDLQPLSGTNYYRLRMVDIDGNFTYSTIIIIQNDTNNNLFKIFPNPANDILYIQANGVNDAATLEIFDASGRKLLEQRIVLNGNAPYSIDIKYLPKGIYDLLLKSKTNNNHQKFVKQ